MAPRPQKPPAPGALIRQPVGAAGQLCSVRLAQPEAGREGGRASGSPLGRAQPWPRAPGLTPRPPLISWSSGGPLCLSSLVGEGGCRAMGPACGQLEAPGGLPVERLGLPLRGLWFLPCPMAPGGLWPPSPACCVSGGETEGTCGAGSLALGVWLGLRPGPSPPVLPLLGGGGLLATHGFCAFGTVFFFAERRSEREVGRPRPARRMPCISSPCRRQRGHFPGSWGSRACARR